MYGEDFGLTNMADSNIGGSGNIDNLILRVFSIINLCEARKTSSLENFDQLYFSDCM